MTTEHAHPFHKMISYQISAAAQHGQELLLSYGVGDLFARVTRIGVETALALFEDEPDA